MALELTKYEAPDYGIPVCPEFAAEAGQCAVWGVATALLAGSGQRVGAVRGVAAYLAGLEASGAGWHSPGQYSLLDGLGELVWPSVQGMSQ